MYTHAELRVYIVGQTSNLHINATKCVSDFEDLNRIGEENSIVKARVYTNSVCNICNVTVR